MNEKIPRYRLFVYLLAAFLAGCLFAGLAAGLVIAGQRPAGFGELDRRYTAEHSRATEIVRRLEDELGRERELNRQLREHNNRARELAEGLADASERNVRNLSDAISLISEIRAKLKVLADFYTDSNTGDSGH